MEFSFCNYENVYYYRNYLFLIAVGVLFTYDIKVSQGVTCILKTVFREKEVLSVEEKKSKISECALPCNK